MQEPASVPLAPSTPPHAELKVVAEGVEADKGLKSNAIGLISSTVIGVASTAPAYSLAVTLGLVTGVIGMGLKSPAIMLVSFVPMIFIAASYYYLNKVDPDCGTTFSWVTRAIGPQTGWVTGWVMVAADIIVMASLAQITGSYFFLLIGANGLAASTFWVTLAGVVFLILMSVVTALGIEISAKIQWFLLGFEYLMLIVFSVVALAKVYTGHPTGSVHVAGGWFLPNMHTGALWNGILLALFIYWGWDTAVSVNEETKSKSRIPGIAAVLSTLALVFIYTLVTTAAQSFAGTGFLTKNSADILSPLGNAVLGSGLNRLLIAVVLTSATASTLTTILPGARTTLSMAAHKAIPSIWARINPRFKTPVWGTAIYGILSLIWYVGLTLLSQNVLADSIAALGLTIAFYYGINGFAVPLFYRRHVLKNWKNFLLLGAMPLLGGIMLAAVFIGSLDQLWYPANSASGTSWFGVGPPFILGLAFIFSGVIGMYLVKWFWRPSRPYFARKMETVETMTPWVPEAVLDVPTGASSPNVASMSGRTDPKDGLRPPTDNLRPPSDIDHPAS
jgi:amino acid transporter